MFVVKLPIYTQKLYVNRSKTESKRIILIKRVRLNDFMRLGVILPLGANFYWTERSLLK